MSRHRPLLLALLCFSMACTATCEDETEPPPLGDCAAPLLRDDGGGVLVLRGVNVSAEAKWNSQLLPPYGTHTLRHLRDDLGMNTIRLLVFWEGIEPYPGLYDETYLAAIAELVDNAAELDMHVIVDMHQDVYGRGFGQAGAPWWSCDPELYATFEERDPWFLGYLQREVGACFDRLYRRGPTQAAFYGAWEVLASRLADSDAVLGYDLLNEPFWGSTSAPAFEREELPDFYRGLIDVVRHADPDPFVVIEPAPASNVGVHSELPKFDHDRLLYGPHFYPPSVELGTGYHGDGDALREQLEVLCADAARLDAPLVIGEFGVRRNVEGGRAYLRDFYGVLDHSGIGALYWNLQRGGSSSYGILEKDGRPAWPAELSARPYPRRTAGTPHGWSWDDETGVFVTTWTEDGSASGQTRIAVPRAAFPTGADVKLQGNGPYELRGAVLHVPQQGGKRRVVIRRRPPERAGTVPDAGHSRRASDVAEGPTPDAGNYRSATR